MKQQWWKWFSLFLMFSLIQACAGDSGGGGGGENGDEPVPENAAEGASFTDTDIGTNEIAGDLTIIKAEDESDLTHYVIYFGSDAETKADETPLDMVVKTGSDITYSISNNTSTGGASHILVFTKNENGEMESGISLGITDYRVLGGTVQGRELSLSTVVTTVAGPDETTTSGDVDGSGSTARFDNPYGITTDGSALFVVDRGNHKIREVTPSTWQVTTLFGDGSTSNAEISEPAGITTDGSYLYFINYGWSGSNQGITKLNPDLTSDVAVIVNDASGDFNFPEDVVHHNGFLYVADTDNDLIKKVDLSDNSIETFAGGGDGNGSTASDCGDDTTDCGSTSGNCYDGTGTDAKFNSPKGLTTDGTNLYVSDANNCRIRKIVISTGVVTTLAGDGDSSSSIDGTGTNASIGTPVKITTDGINLYVTDDWFRIVRKIVINTAEVTSLAGSGTYGSIDGTGSAAEFANPSGIVSDGERLYITNENNLRQME